MWKTGCRLVGGCVLLGLVWGCQGQSIFTWWKSRQDEEYRLLLKSVDEYARKQGLSREQAIRQLREEADRYALQQKQQGILNPTQGGVADQAKHRSGAEAAQASWTALPQPPAASQPETPKTSGRFPPHQGI